MEIVITEPTKIQTFAFIFQNIKTFTDSVSVQFDDNGMYIQAMDNSHITIFDIKLKNDWFTTYKVSENINIGINSNIIHKILNIIDKGHTLHIAYSLNSDNIDISFLSDNKDILNKEFTMPLIEIDIEQMGIPETDSTAQFTMTSVNFISIIQQLSIFGDSLCICCNEKNIDFIASGDNGKMTVNIDIDDLDEFAIVEDESLKLNFSLIYLNKIASYSKICKNAEIHLTDNYPVQINYYLDNNNTIDNSIRFYLAPQLCDEDD